ncbi:MAG: phosphopyruvate hydratase [Candidatus Nealsonbacteria bacterium]|nr:MAG: phosphopyruvate hydratase [Candidatus Nealsonbacteria bacterium]
MAKIKNLKAREILNSKGNWTIEAELETEQGVFKASVPSGTSRGKYEAVEVEAKKAVENIEKIIKPNLKGEDPTDQKRIDTILIELDGTENKSKLGGNSLLVVSIACVRAGAAERKMSLFQYIKELENFLGGSISTQSPENRSPITLPKPCFNILNGGVHAGNDLDIQEFIVVPQRESFKENLRVGVEIYQKLKEILKENFGNFAINLGDEGGFAPPLKKTQEPLDLIMEAIKKVGYEKEVKIALDCAASQLFQEGKYNFEGKEKNEEELANFYLNLVKQYPILFFEDPFSQEDWQGWMKISNLKLSGFLKSAERIWGRSQISNLLIVGDDLTVTNPKRIKEAFEKKACNGIILKPNQVGTVTETLEAAKLAKKFGWKIIVSHRSGDTCDDFIADLAVGVGADFIKAGAPARGERTAKYNRLLKIEKEL